MLTSFLRQRRTHEKQYIGQIEIRQCRIEQIKNTYKTRLIINHLTLQNYFLKIQQWSLIMPF